MKYRVSFMLCCDETSVKDTSTRSRHVRGFVKFRGVLSVAGLGLVHFLLVHSYLYS